MRAFLLSLALLLAGAGLSSAALLTDAPVTALGPTCTSLGVLVAVINNRREDTP
jgi:hypothetical protein